MPQSIFERLGNKPPAAELLGWDLIDFDKQRQSIRIAFLGQNSFTNPTGSVQGGFIAAMLDELMGSSIIMATDGAYMSATISITVDFVRPAPAGPITGEGQVTNLGKSIAFVEGKLFDQQQRLLARGTASCKLVPMNPDWLAKTPG